jgi:hypothetical protein
VTTFVSVWRCDPCGETINVLVAAVQVDSEGNVLVEATVGDMLIHSMPCPICARDMRRVESAGDLRDWGESLRSAGS